MKPLTDLKETLRREIGDAARRLRAPAPSDGDIHHARKNLKRARANLRLLREAVGNAAYRKENAALRDAARPLAAARDARAMIETAVGLIEETQSPTQRALLEKLRMRLEQSLREARQAIEHADVSARSAAALDEAWQRVDRWKVPGRRPALVRRGGRDIYKRARKAYRRAERKPTPERLHELRKQIKYLHLAMAAVGSESAAPVAKLIRRADAVADDLGVDHDLVVLRERVLQLHARPERARPALFEQIDARRAHLQTRALTRSRKLLRAKPKRFLQALTA